MSPSGGGHTVVLRVHYGTSLRWMLTQVMKPASSTSAGTAGRLRENLHYYQRSAVRLRAKMRQKSSEETWEMDRGLYIALAFSSQSASKEADE